MDDKRLGTQLEDVSYIPATMNIKDRVAYSSWERRGNAQWYEYEW